VIARPSHHTIILNLVDIYISDGLRHSFYSCMGLVIWAWVHYFCLSSEANMKELAIPLEKGNSTAHFVRIEAHLSKQAQVVDRRTVFF